LLFVGTVVRELVLQDGTSVRDKRTDDVFFEVDGKVEVGPGFVAVLEHRHLKHELVDVLEIALAAAL
jgi:hypothetical protein